MAGDQERRQGERFIGRLPLEWDEGNGITRDFSAFGVYFHTKQTFLSGQPIEFALVLEHALSEHPVRLKCQGSVVRVEPRGYEETGVAVTISSYGYDQFNQAG